MFVYVRETEPGEATRQLESITLAAEKVRLALKAFRTLRIDAKAAQADPRLGPKSASAPRFVVVHPERERPTLFERSQLSVSSVFAGLERVSDTFYEEPLSTLVRTHLELLTDQDALVLRETKLLEERKAAPEPVDAASRSRIAELEGLLAIVRQELEQVAKRQEALWQLTRRRDFEGDAGKGPGRPPTLGTRPTPGPTGGSGPSSSGPGRPPLAR